MFSSSCIDKDVYPEGWLCDAAWVSKCQIHKKCKILIAFIEPASPFWLPSLLVYKPHYLSLQIHLS